MISVGSISVPKTMANRSPRPLKLNFAKAYPASAERKTVLTVVTPATNTLFRSARKKGAEAASASRLWRKLEPGSRRGGDLNISDSASVAAVNVQ